MDRDFYQGCLLLGKTWQALGNYKLACQALRGALQGRLSHRLHPDRIGTG